LYSFLSFSFGLRRVGRLALRLNDAAVRQGFSLSATSFSFSSTASLFESMLPRVHPAPFSFAQVALSGRILFLTGADHRKRDECRKEQRFFHEE